MKKTFILYLDNLNVLDDLTDEQAGQLFKAIKQYQTEKKTDLHGLMKAVFTPFQTVLDKDDIKYEDTCEKRRQAGAKGGRKKAANLANLANANFAKKSVANLADNDNDNDNDNDITLLKEKEKEKISLLINREELKKTDPFSNPLLDDYFSTYKQNCTNLCKLGFEPRNRETRELLSAFIDEIKNDVGYFNSLCLKANELKTICNKQIDFKSLLRNHIGIMNGKYKEKTAMDEIEELFKSRKDDG